MSLRPDLHAFDRADSLVTLRRIAPHVRMLTITDAAAADEDEYDAISDLRGLAAHRGACEHNRSEMMRHAVQCTALHAIEIAASAHVLNAFGSALLPSVVAIALIYAPTHSRRSAMPTPVASTVHALPMLQFVHLKNVQVREEEAVALLLVLRGAAMLSSLTIEERGIVAGGPQSGAEDGDPPWLQELVIRWSTAFGAIAARVFAPRSLTLCGTDHSTALVVPNVWTVSSVCLDGYHLGSLPALARMPSVREWYFFTQSADVYLDIALLERAIEFFDDPTCFADITSIAYRTAEDDPRRSRLVRELYQKASARFKNTAGEDDDETTRAIKQSQLHSEFNELVRPTLSSQVKKYRPRSPFRAAPLATVADGEGTEGAEDDDGAEEQGEEDGPDADMIVDGASETGS